MKRTFHILLSRETMTKIKLSQIVKHVCTCRMPHFLSLSLYMSAFRQLFQCSIFIRAPTERSRHSVHKMVSESVNMECTQFLQRDINTFRKELNRLLPVKNCRKKLFKFKLNDNIMPVVLGMCRVYRIALQCCCSCYEEYQLNV